MQRRRVWKRAKNQSWQLPVRAHARRMAEGVPLALTGPSGCHWRGKRPVPVLPSHPLHGTETALGRLSQEELSWLGPSGTPTHPGHGTNGWRQLRWWLNADQRSGTTWPISPLPVSMSFLSSVARDRDFTAAPVKDPTRVVGSHPDRRATAEDSPSRVGRPVRSTKCLFQKP